MKTNMRNALCGNVTANQIGEEVVLCGWVAQHRNHGGVGFMNLRDRSGVVQIVIDEETDESLKSLFAELKAECCLSVKGTLRKRPPEMVNMKMKTGEVEVLPTVITELSHCETLPFIVEEEIRANEGLRLKYRYIDLRSGGMQSRIALRHTAKRQVIEFLNDSGFYDIETPTLIASTPEGARDFLVPSRPHPGHFYALAQSPQLYKQLLMVSGFDRYYQFARCYRDEDARGDRQPEFTQIDLEMSFVSKEDIFSLIEGMLNKLFKNTLDVTLPNRFPRLSYKEAMERYGSDKPDVRIPWEFKEFSGFCSQSDFSLFKKALEEGGIVKALVVPGGGVFTRKKIDGLEDVAKKHGAGGLAWTRVTEDGFEGGIGRFFSDNSKEIKASLSAESGDILFFGAGSWHTALTALGAVRTAAARELEFPLGDRFEFLWVDRFPLYEKNEETGGWTPAHHIFSMPTKESLEKIESAPGEVEGDIYDLVLNGYELASGSIRIHNPELQYRVLDVVGMPREVAEERFGFLLEAFSYGPPPHGGIALGFDRLIMVMSGCHTIKDVIPFPKNNTAASPLDNSPVRVSEDQLKDLSIALWKQE